MSFLNKSSEIEQELKLFKIHPNYTRIHKQKLIKLKLNTKTIYLGLRNMEYLFRLQTTRYTIFVDTTASIVVTRLTMITISRRRFYIAAPV